MMDIKYPRVNIPMEHISLPGPNKYLVKPGDTLAQIARRFDISPDDLIKYNNLKHRHQLMPGQEIDIPPQSKSMTIEKAITISGGSPYAAASRVNQSWNNLIGKKHEREISEIKAHLGFNNDMSISYSKKSYFPLKLLHVISFSPIGRRSPLPFLSALSIFCKESKAGFIKSSPSADIDFSEISQKSLQTIQNAVKFLSGSDLNKLDIFGKNNKISDYFKKTGFKNLVTDDNFRSAAKAVVDALNAEGIKTSVVSEPQKHDLNQMDLFLATLGTVMGW